MFTGIVQGIAQATEVVADKGVTHITVQFPEGKLENLTKGASIALNGTCLTVTEFDADTARFDIIAESLRVTNLGKLAPGSKVNFERAARVGDEIGGHGLSGHIHTTVIVSAIEKRDHDVRVSFRGMGVWQKYILPKGYVALNGCSLTIGEVTDDEFCVYLIPETLEITLFGTAQVGDEINLEVDSQTQSIVDTVERVLATRTLS